MTRARIIALVLFSLLVVSSAFAQTLTAVLTGAQEVPPNNGAGFGNATVTFVPGAPDKIDVTITVANLGSPINNYHIHEATFGLNGQVRVDLIGQAKATFVNGTLSARYDIDPLVAQRMKANPQSFYVNIHTVQFPGGAIRGQLTYASGGAITYAADLRPANEVPPANSSAYGSAFVTFDPTNNTIAWDVATNGILNPTMSHIHRGAAGANGPVIVNFATSSAQIPAGRTAGSGLITDVQSGNLTPADLVALSSPATAIGYYVNVHSNAFPGGEVRGQLVPANEYDIPVAGRVTNGMGQTFVTDVRIFNPSYTANTTALVEFLPAGLAGNNSASISRAVVIPARGTAVLDDVTGGAFLNTPGVIGALRVSSATSLVVSSRIYADLRASGRGTFGQFVPATPRASGLSRGVLPQLAQSAETTSGFRTNVGLFNPNPFPVTVRLELRDDGGNVFGHTTLTLAQQSLQQTPLTGLFAGVEHNHAGTMTLTYNSAVPIVVYAAVNDNASGDSFFVSAQPDVGTVANQ